MAMGKEFEDKIVVTIEDKSFAFDRNDLGALNVMLQWDSVKLLKSEYNRETDEYVWKVDDRPKPSLMEVRTVQWKVVEEH